MTSLTQEIKLNSRSDMHGDLCDGHEGNASLIWALVWADGPVLLSVTFQLLSVSARRAAVNSPSDSFFVHGSFHSGDRTRTGGVHACHAPFTYSKLWQLTLPFDPDFRGELYKKFNRRLHSF